MSQRVDSSGVIQLKMPEEKNCENTSNITSTWAFFSLIYVMNSYMFLSKMYGGKPLLLITLIVNGTLSLATPALAKIGDWVAVCAVRAGMGLTQACLMPASHTLLGKWAPPQERSRLGVIAYAGIQMGTVFTMPLCGILSQTSLGWKLIFYAMGGLSLFTAIIWLIFTASTPREHRFMGIKERDYIEKSLGSTGQPSPPTPWKKLFTSVPLLAIVCGHIGFNWSFLIFLVEIPTYLKKGLNIDLAKSSSLSALPFFAQWLVAAACSIVSDILYNKKILTLSSCRKLFNTIGSVGVALGMIVLSFLTSEQSGLAVTIVTFSGGILGCCTCGFLLNHIDLSPNFPGIMYAITNCIASLIGILAPLSTGFIRGEHPDDASRWRIIYCFSACLLLASDVIFRLCSTSDIQEWNEPDKNEISLDAVKLNPAVDNANEKNRKTYTFSESN